MDKDILAEAKDAFAECEEAESDNRNRALEDLRFGRLAEQWDEGVRKQRQEDGRPCLTINKMPAFIRQVVNDSRQNRPQIKVQPIDSGADVETANILGGLIRNIEQISNADVAYDTAIDFAVSMGWGYWRVALEYACEDSFDLDLLIKRVSNPFTVYGDPQSTEADSSDWNVAFITEMIKRDEFKRQYPDAEPSDWNSEGMDEKDRQWFSDDSVRVAEYWKRTKEDGLLLVLSNGQVLDEQQYVANKDLFDAEGLAVTQERAIKVLKVTQHLLGGDGPLEKKTNWPGKYIPIVPVYGEELNVEGERIFLSLINQAKDAQRNFNYWRTSATEMVALAPRAPFIGPTEAFNSAPEKWATANKVNHPYLPYDGPVAPQRQAFSGVAAGDLQEALNASDDMKTILGLYDASLGARSNETSGKAIMARQREGDISTFHFIDNVSRSIRHTGRILIDLIPHVYSQRKVVRVLGEDKTTQAVPLNTEVQQKDGTARIYDLTAGKYDLSVTAGPSFTTRREEAATQMMELLRAFPQAAPVIGDILAKNLDWPGSDEIAERLKALQQNQSQPQPDPDAQKAEAQLQIKQKEAEMNSQIKMQEHQQSMQFEAEKHQAEMQRGKDKTAQEMYGKAMGELSMAPEGMPQHPLLMMVESIVSSNQMVAQTMQMVAQSMMAPKELIRDEKGRAVGVKTVTIQ